MNDVQANALLSVLKGIRADLHLIAQRIDEGRQSLDELDTTMSSMAGDVEMAREILGSFDFSK